MPRIITHSIKETIKYRTAYCRRMEFRYEVTSRQMFNDLRSGKAKDTAEVVRWMMAWEMLQELIEIDAKDSKT